jgi:hypothetical protein
MTAKRTAPKKSVKTATKTAAKKSSNPPSRRWSAKVTTVSTYPEHDLFNQDAKTVAEHLASRKVSPKGPASGMRMLNFYINRAGKNLPTERHTELEKAKGILSGIIAEQKKKAVPKKAPATKKAAAKKNSEKSK